MLRQRMSLRQCTDLIEFLDVETEDVVEVVDVVQMLRHQVRQLTATLVAEVTKTETGWEGGQRVGTQFMDEATAATT